MSAARCAGEGANECRDDVVAFHLKMIAIGAILIAVIIGVMLPLVGKKRWFLRTDGGLFVFAKSFAAGVILSTGIVDMLARWAVDADGLVPAGDAVADVSVLGICCDDVATGISLLRMI